MLSSVPTGGAQRHEILIPETLETSFELEWSVHRPPRRFYREIVGTFPDIDNQQDVRISGSGGKDSPVNPLLVVPTFQPSRVDLLAIGVDAEDEKNRLLEKFLKWSNYVRNHIMKKDHWADVSDPCSGVPYFGNRGCSFYPDVEGCRMLLKYRTLQCEACVMILHPRWSSKAYPATFFTTAPLDVLQDALAYASSCMITYQPGRGRG
eukprot:TRINITY_DN5168_c0_g1_i1.p1 TRINITY_DN5168_c0_g1~~TRINITY_DN5168_c0_g1_i1.p1  ORF type:complete len:207 (+),score=16.25 TRINITY_DN5168_c0_g1_i1:204-824(+)